MYSDIHNHIVFGVDDGPKTLEESLNLLKQAKEQRIKKVTATPHVNHRQYRTTLSKIHRNFLIVQSEARKKNIDIKLTLSQELTLSIDLFEKYPLETLRPLIDCYAQRYLLIEVNSIDVPYYFEDCLGALRQKNINCIWAHPERNIAVQGNWKIVKELKQIKNLYVQVTAGSILGDFGKKTQKTTWKLLKKGLVDFVASDAHDENDRPFRLEEALKILKKKLNDENYSRIIQNMNNMRGGNIKDVDV